MSQKILKKKHNWDQVSTRSLRPSTLLDGANCVRYAMMSSPFYQHLILYRHSCCLFASVIGKFQQNKHLMAGFSQLWSSRSLVSSSLMDKAVVVCRESRCTTPSRWWDLRRSNKKYSQPSPSILWQRVSLNHSSRLRLEKCFLTQKRTFSVISWMEIPGSVSCKLRIYCEVAGIQIGGERWYKEMRCKKNSN